MKMQDGIEIVKKRVLVQQDNKIRVEFKFLAPKSLNSNILANIFVCEVAQKLLIDDFALDQEIQRQKKETEDENNIFKSLVNSVKENKITWDSFAELVCELTITLKQSKYLNNLLLEELKRYRNEAKLKAKAELFSKKTKQLSNTNKKHDDKIQDDNNRFLKKQLDELKVELEERKNSSKHMKKNVDEEISQYVDEIVQSRDALIQENTHLVQKYATQNLELKLLKNKLIEANNEVQEIKVILDEKNDELEKTKKSKEIYEKLFSKHASTSLNINHQTTKELTKNNAAEKFLPLPLILDEIEIQENKMKKKFSDVKCAGCHQITTVFNQAQTDVSCIGCSTILLKPQATTITILPVTSKTDVLEIFSNNSTDTEHLDHHDIDTTVLSKPNVDEESEIITKANVIKNQEQKDSKLPIKSSSSLKVNDEISENDMDDEITFGKSIPQQIAVQCQTVLGTVGTSQNMYSKEEHKFSDVKCPGCQKITTVFNNAQNAVSCIGCSTILHQPSKDSGARSQVPSKIDVSESTNINSTDKRVSDFENLDIGPVTPGSGVAETSEHHDKDTAFISIPNVEEGEITEGSEFMDDDVQNLENQILSPPHKSTSNVPKDSRKSTLSNSRKRWLDDEVEVNIFNLKRTVTKDDLFDLFEDVGKIQRININNSLKGAVGEVVFSRREAAEEAIKLYDNKYLDGRKMEFILIENGQYVTKKSPKSTSTSCLKNASNERKESTNKSTIGYL